MLTGSASDFRSSAQKRRGASHAHAVRGRWRVAVAAAFVLFCKAGVAADFNPNTAALTSLDTCDALLTEEEKTGGQLLVPNPGTPVTLFTIKRLFDGDPAALVYVCNRTGRIVNRIVYMHFQDGNLARAAFEKHRQSITRELGVPCWNPKQLTSKQKDLLPGGDLASLPALAKSMIWNGPSGQSVSLHIREPLKSSDSWQLRVSDDFSGVALNEVVRSIYRASGCSTQHLTGE